MCIQKEKKSCLFLHKGNHVSGNRLFILSSWQTPFTVNTMHQAERVEENYFSFVSGMYKENPSR